MSTRTRQLAAALLVAAAGLTGCARADAPATTSDDPPVVLSSVAHSSLKQVSVSERAAQRLGIRTAPVRQAARPDRTEVPYSAIVYAEDGSAWTYVTRKRLTYLRHAVTVADVRDGTALLSRGPAVREQVVTTGTQELLGAEYEISGE